MRRAALFVALLSIAGAAAAGDPYRVIDGDTIAFGETHIRLLGLDAPETKLAKCPLERQLGQAATAELARLLASGPVTIEKRKNRDKYGRVLAVVRVGGLDVADAMITAGLARPYDGRSKRGSWCPGVE